MTIDEAAKKIWDYMILDQQPVKSDVILVLGSIDEHVAEYGARLLIDGYGDCLMISGGSAHQDDLLATSWKEPTEAEHFKTIAIRDGVPEDKILLETKATNTGENAKFSHLLLQEKNLNPTSIIVVQKPYMERRTYATFKKQWPDSNTKIQVTSSPFAYEDYFEANDSTPKETIINIMVGDLQRIKEYPRLGFQIEQEIPTDVWSAYEFLTSKGYTQHLIKE